MPHEPDISQKEKLEITQSAETNSSQLESRDVQLIIRITNGDLRAFDALYRSYFPRLVRFLDRYTRRTALIEEIINDTMFVVWEKADAYNQTSKVSTWIFAIAYRKAMKTIKRTDDPQEADFDLVQAGIEMEPDSQLSQRQLQQCVSHALDAISVEQRTVVSLAYYHGMDYQEIATTMDCPVNTVKTRMFHARKRLQNLLAKVMESL